MRLILVRHPQPVVAPGICYGATDLPAAPDDIDRVHTALLASASIPPDAPIYSSPLRRCAALAHRLGTPIFDARLAEMDFGAWEMRAWDDIPRAEVDAWAADLAAYHPGGGESVQEVAERVMAFHAELLRQRHAHAVIVCHAGTIRLLGACANGLPPREVALLAASKPHRLAYGEAVILEANR
ncbi:histidine phosphatase family protein [Pseudoduganella namucuonensis]|uniref:Alpha-ribazole phosphatase n=1 Tax=Pseudoduganella namucuonensis TaxID=1035707 RepID=A0A1I7M6M4_9BURK|nr:histidine phosphatase family protein [Pseudoduganella namucuonensis]SFV17601.1 alpha-ribazole phosphatase [Pseudoduganella namucuonensis]